MKSGNEFVTYIRVDANVPLTIEPRPTKYKAAVIVDIEVTAAWRNQFADQLVRSNCVWMSAWGHEGTYWDDAVDSANLERFDYTVPENKHIMTTWHDDESLEEFLWFVRVCATTDMSDGPIEECVIFDITSRSREAEILQIYAAAD